MFWDPVKKMINIIRDVVFFKDNNLEDIQMRVNHVIYIEYPILSN